MVMYVSHLVVCLVMGAGERVQCTSSYISQRDVPVLCYAAILPSAYVYQTKCKTIELSLFSKFASSSPEKAVDNGRCVALHVKT